MTIMKNTGFVTIELKTKHHDMLSHKTELQKETPKLRSNQMTYDVRQILYFFD